nr:SRPBCC family protein [Bradyrhizobium sp.]
NDEKGASTPDGTFRVFAGLRSDPFILAWIVSAMKPFQNLLLHDNVLCIVIEFDTRRVLDPDRGSLFGAIAETVPLTRLGEFVGSQPPRIDWAGRPEQTNVRLNCPFLGDVDDLRDLWNQQTPFAIADGLRPLFLQRLKESLAAYDMRDGKQDWTPAALAANANMFLEDYMLFDVAKPITDGSHLEIEKSTLDGKAYETGGGRTVDADVIDVLLTWMVNRDREPLRGGTTKATKPGAKTFPYFATPNLELQQVTESINLDATPDRIWELIGQFGGDWHPLIANIKLIGNGIGQLRMIETIDGKQIIERLDAIDNSARSYRYTNISGIPASDYTGTLAVKPNGAGSSVEWQAQYLGNGQGDLIVRTIVSTLFKTGLESLKPRFGAAK